MTLHECNFVSLLLMKAFLKKTTWLLLCIVTGLGCFAKGIPDREPESRSVIHMPGILLKNLGQFDSEVQYQLKQDNANIIICNDRLIYQMVFEHTKSMHQTISDTSSHHEIANVHVEFLACNKDYKYIEEGSEEAYCNFFNGSDSSTWKSSIPMLTGVTAVGVYPYIDAKFYTSKTDFKSDFILHPGSVISDIKLRYKGIQGLEIASNGELIITIGDHEIREHIPLAYQNVGHEKLPVNVRYTMLDEETISFVCDHYDNSLDLIIDPVLIFSTYLGGSNAEPWTGPSVIKDAAGNIYTAGSTASSNFPTTAGTYDISYNGGSYDVYVVKLSPNGANLLFATYIGGSSTDFVSQIALDPATNDIIISGMTGGGGFPTTAGAYQTVYAGGLYDIYCTRFNNAGNNLVFSTLIGGISSEQGTSLSLDAGGNIWITGYSPGDFPVTAGAYQVVAAGGYDAVVCKLNPSGSSLLYATYVGGSGDDRANGIKADNSGNVYIKGMTTGAFPVVTGSYDLSFNGGANDLFMSKLNPVTNALIYSTYLGSAGDDWSDQRLTITANNELLVTGRTGSGFPTTTGAYDQTFNGSSDGFVSLLNSAGNALVFSSYLGGSGADQTFDAQVALNGDIVVTGYCANGIPATTCAYDLSFNGGSEDAFVSIFNSSFSSLKYSTYFGGSGNDRGCSICIDADSLILLGVTSSANFPVTTACYDGSSNGGGDPFILKFYPSNDVMPVAGFVATDTICIGQIASFTNTSTPAYANAVWSFGDQSFSTLSSPTHLYTVPGVYQVSLIASTACGNDTVWKTVVVGKIPFDIGDVVTMDLGSMISYYPMDNSVQDFSGHGLHGSVYGPVIDTGACTVLDQGYRFTPTSQFISLPHTPFYNALPLTISFWYRKNNASILNTPGPMGECEGLVFKNDDTGADMSFDFEVADEIPPFRTVLLFGNGSTVGVLETPNVIQPYTWYHVAGVLNGNKGKLYLDGVLMDTDSIAGSIAFNNLPILLGKVPVNGEPYRFLNGSLDELRIYGRVLSDCEIKYLASVCNGNNPELGVQVLMDSLCPGDSANITIVNPEYQVTYQLLNSLTLLPVSNGVTAYCDSAIMLTSLPLSPPFSLKILATNLITGCSIILDTTISLSAQLPITVQHSLSICPGDSAFLGGSFTQLPGVYYDTIHVVNGCDSLTVTTLSSFLVTPPALGPDTSFCPPQTVTLFGPSGSFSYLWSTGSAQDSLVVAQTGSYWLQITDANSCISSDTIQVTLLQPPVLNLGLDTIVCIGVAVVLNPGPGFNTYLWSTGATSALLTVTQNGTYGVTVSNSGNCQGNDSITVLFQAGTVNNLPPDTGSCAGDTIVLNVLHPAQAYLWNTGHTTASVEVYMPGEYIVTVTDLTGCQSPDTIMVTLDPVLVITASPYTATICEDSAIVLNVYGATAYQWSPAIGLSSVTAASVTASPLNSITYLISGTAEGACPGDTSISVLVVPAPVSTLPDSTLLCDGNSIVLDPGMCDLCTYTWSDGSISPALTITTQGLYWVKINNEGCQLIDTINVGACFEIWVPNVFTPNGDGKNDSFHPLGQQIQSYKMLIYNRWGEMLFESNEFGQGWDGTYKGKECPEGVYVYLITYSGWATGLLLVNDKRTGTVTLFR